MKAMCRIAYIFLLFLSLSIQSQAQRYFFAEANESDLTIAAAGPGKRVLIPEKYRTLALNVNGLKSYFKRLPLENRLGGPQAFQTIELPLPDGSRAGFRIWETFVMEPGLAAKFPGIKTYSGQGIDDPTATVRLDYTEQGFHAMIVSDVTGNVFIDPYRQLDQQYYVVYFKKDFRKNDSFQELGPLQNPDIAGQALLRPAPGPCKGTQLKSYRLAVACTGEYARAAVGIDNPTVAQTLSAVVTTINRVDGIYEKELSISLNLVAANNQVIFTDPAADPFTANNDGEALLDESQAVITEHIGPANYDIGHTFSTGAGGIAQLGTVCGNSKARGVTGLDKPFNDPFDIDYVAHEMGHQFDASHTFNATTGSCSGNRNDDTAVEPGSGITIMGYAGICATSNNIGQNSIPFFHPVSMDEINAFTISGSGNGCGTLSATGNIVPIVNAGNNYTIPRSTPFALTGSASDANGDALTYSWEEVDNGPAGNWNSPTGNAPLFRSFPPVSSPTRYFPNLADQLANTTTIGEILPSYARNMNFRLTARDNRAGGGGVCYDEMSVVVDGNSGPFTVTYPSAAGISWSGGGIQTVTWNVANSNSAPVNCANVTIQLSTDGGVTFPITLLASTPNDGSQTITVPDIVTSTARIRVMAVGNIFYDISNNNFAITVAQPGFDFINVPETSIACANASATSVLVGTQSVLGYTSPVTLSVAGNPPGTSVSLSATTVTPGSPVTVTLSNTQSLPFNTSYTLTVTGVSGTITRTQDITFNILPGVAPVILEQPKPQAVCNNASATFSVATASPVSGYQWEVTEDGQVYSVIPAVNSPSYTIDHVSENMDGWRYRVILVGQCNATTSAEALLHVYSLPEVMLTPNLQSITPGQTSTLTAIVTPGSGTDVSTIWTLDGDPITVPGTTLPVTVTGLGSYQVTVSDEYGCSNTSDVVTITAEPSSRLFIYPSPGSGRFTVSYYNSNGANTRQSVTIYDARGARVYNKLFTLTSPYQLLDVDISGKARGVYFVVVGDANGHKVIDGKVLIQ